MEITDQYQRSFRKLRISLNSRCNLGCVYCVSEEEEQQNRQLPASEQEKSPVLQPEAFGRIVRAFQQLLDIDQIRLTGGEPLLYPHLSGLVERLTEEGITDIGMTSNASLLKNTAGRLSKAGLKSINVSLDAVNPEAFWQVTRRKNLKQVLQGIDAAVKAGIEVKINAVIMKGLNEDEILPLLDYARERGIVIRFLEVMSMGHLHKEEDNYFFPEKAILERIGSRYHYYPVERAPSATANYWQTEDGNQFGIIANTSSPFCHDCNRLRLDSSGYIYGCLSNPEGIYIMDCLGSPAELQSRLKQALNHKQPGVFTGSNLSMKAIGG